MTTQQEFAIHLEQIREIHALRAERDALRGALEACPCLDANGQEGWTCIEHDGTGLWCKRCAALADKEEK